MAAHILWYGRIIYGRKPVTWTAELKVANRTWRAMYTSRAKFSYLRPSSCVAFCYSAISVEKLISILFTKSEKNI